MNGEVSLESTHAEKPDPLWHNDGTVGFDYDAADGEQAPDSTSMSRKDVAEAVGRIFEWVVGADDERNLKRFTLRSLAAAYAMTRLGNDSQRAVAVRFGIENHRRLSEVVAAFDEAFPGLLQSRFQSHAWNRGLGRSAQQNPPITEEKPHSAN